MKTDELVQLTKELIQINSINPWLIPSEAGETELASHIANWLKCLPLEVNLEEVEGGRCNLIARLPGSGGGKSLCLYAHLDTVGCELWKDRAFSPRLENDRLYGLGAADDKGHCAIAMLVIKSLVEHASPLRGDVWLALLMDEEGTSSGTMHFVEHHRPDATLVLEPAGLGNIVITHQGFGWLDIIVKGRAAHGCAPEKGIDAIVHMAEVITRLHRLDREVFASSPHPLNDKTVFHTSLISGGTDYATYPAECILGIEIGTQPGETIANRVAEIEDIFRQVENLHPDFQGEVRVKLARDPFEACGHEDLWAILSAEVERVIGRPAKAVGENAWGDAALFQQAGIPTLMLGAYGENFHAPDEWVAIPELIQLGEILESTILKFCS